MHDESTAGFNTAQRGHNGERSTTIQPDESMIWHGHRDKSAQTGTHRKKIARRNIFFLHDNANEQNGEHKTKGVHVTETPIATTQVNAWARSKKTHSHNAHNCLVL